MRGSFILGQKSVKYDITQRADLILLFLCYIECVSSSHYEESCKTEEYSYVYTTGIFFLFLYINIFEKGEAWSYITSVL